MARRSCTDPAATGGGRARFPRNALALTRKLESSGAFKKSINIEVVFDGQG